MQVRKFLKRNSLFIGVCLMFLFTWPIDLAYAGLLPFQVPFPVYLFLGWGFVAASILMTWLTLGRTSVAALLKRFLLWNVGWKWYVIAFLLFPAIQMIALILNTLVSGTSPDFKDVFATGIFGESANLWLFVIPFFLIDAISNGEEIGWRGYVLPRLQAKHSALVSSLILGVIWGMWHIPKNLGDGEAGAFGLLMVRIIAEAILYTWLFNNTKGSLLLVTIFHAAGNTAGVFLPSGGQMELWVVGLTWVAALVVIKQAGYLRLSPKLPVQALEV